jgi:hypothetical protein
MEEASKLEKLFEDKVFEVVKGMNSGKTPSLMVFLLLFSKLIGM